MALITRRTTTPVTTAVATAALNTEDMSDIVCEVQGITTGTVQIQVSLDGTTWVDEGTALTADGRLVVSGLAQQVRGDVTVATSVSVILVVGGQSQGVMPKSF